MFFTRKFTAFIKSGHFRKIFVTLFGGRNNILPETGTNKKRVLNCPIAFQKRLCHIVEDSQLHFKIKGIISQQFSLTVRAFNFIKFLNCKNIFKITVYGNFKFCSSTIDDLFVLKGILKSSLLVSWLFLPHRNTPTSFVSSSSWVLREKLQSAINSSLYLWPHLPTSVIHGQFVQLRANNPRGWLTQLNKPSCSSIYCNLLNIYLIFTMLELP